MKRYIDRLAWGTDASFYRLIPQEVLMPADEKEVIEVFQRAKKENKHITFRAAGTSLSGQTTGDGLLMVCGKKWEDIEVVNDGDGVYIDAQPGIIGQRINEILQPYGRYFTPDPASIKSAMLGGIVSNNASGMCCGVHANSHRMLKSVRIILADGTVLDTADERSKSDFRLSHSTFIRKIEDLKYQIRKNKPLCDWIQQKYAIKNVTGLNILPFIEFNDPFDIIAHLLVGSEGTLAFMSRVRMKTGVLKSHSASALLLFPTTKEACEAIITMRKTEVLSAAEFFDRKAMRVVEKDFPELQNQPEDAAAVLIRIDGVDEQELEAKKKKIGVKGFTSDPELVHKYWAMRSGIFPAVGATRPIGTTCLIEDVAFPIENLTEATLDLQELLQENGYGDAVIYGHALEGNYHFILNQRFDTPEAIKQYDGMIQAVVDLVVDEYHGSLKAEHGTGRNMAPFVEREWGKEAYEVMKAVKTLFDPNNMLNPGVIFTEDENSHLKHIKPLPKVHPLIDRCIECGFCEVNCVSCGFAFSSRQRIVIQREIASLRSPERSADNEAKLLAQQLEADFRYMGKDLCAGDGLCSMSCPVKINTGEYIHLVRERELSERGKRLGQWAGDHFATVGKALKGIMNVASAAHGLLGDKVMSVAGKALHVGSGRKIPLWTPAMPRAVKSAEIQEALDYEIKHPLPALHQKKVVYFPSCLNQRLGVQDKTKGKSLINDMVELLNKANFEIVFPANMEQLCCGTIWESKGMPDEADKKSQELEQALWIASEEGKWPVLCDQSPCLHRMRKMIKKMRLYEPAEFIDKFMLDELDITPIDASVAIHITCSTREMGVEKSLLRVAKRCAREVLVPEEIGCCAFAGDKGFTHPQLNEWALRKLSKQIREHHVSVGYSNSRTCEIGLTYHSGVQYFGIAKLVNQVSKARNEK